MNAREALHWMVKESGIMSCNDEAWPIAIRALRLLAAAEANDGTTAEVLPSFIAIHLCSDYTRGKCGDPAYDDCCCQKLVRGYEQINNERNGLAARVAELEPDAERYRWLRRHQICYGDDDKGNARVTVDFTVGPWSLSPVSADEAIDSARSKP